MSTQLVENARSAVLTFFRASPDEYDAIFTLNASGALKLVGEAYPFSKGGTYLLTYDNHNSVNGIREFACAKGAKFQYVPITDPDLRVDADALGTLLETPANGRPCLFAYPAQSNFSGVQHSLDWIGRAHDLGWDVLLDAAAFVPTNRLDLSEVRPDFVTVSFYKMFGYPTGVGCLILRKEVAGKMRRPWFAGGTVVMASTHVSKCSAHSGFALQEGASAFEDGTVNYLSIPAVEMGLRYLDSVGIERVHDHVGSLTQRLLGGLSDLRHRDGASLVHVYGPQTMDQRGGSVAMNFFDPADQVIHPRDVEREAARHDISIRTGCHCNPGAGQTALHISNEAMDRVFTARKQMNLDRFRLAADVMREGAVRASLGLPSNERDVDAFVAFASEFRDKPLNELR
jgi:selenocysteine lyase/cysteine desulfurase